MPLRAEDVWNSIDVELSGLLDDRALAFVEVDGVQRPPVGEVRVLRGRLVIVAVPS